MRKLLCLSLYTEVGGGEVGLYHLLKNIDRTRIHPILMVNGEGPLVEMVRALGVEVVIMPFEVVMLKHFLKPSSFLKNWRTAQRISRYVAEQHIEAAVCGDVLALLLLQPAIIKHRLRVIYNVIFYYETLRVLVFNFLAMFTVKSIVVLSAAMKTDLIRRTIGLRRKIVTSYWGVDTKKFYPRSHGERLTLRTALGLPPDRKIVGFIGRYEVWKGHHTFLDAAELLLRKRDDVMFLIVGGAMTETLIPQVQDYHRNVIKRINGMRYRDRVVVWRHRSDIPEIMSAIDVFVCPSDREPYGLVVLEALASGTPVVISDTVGARELVEGLPNVLISEHGKSDDFAQKIETALNEKKWHSEYAPEFLLVLRRTKWAAYARLIEDALHL